MTTNPREGGRKVVAERERVSEHFLKRSLRAREGERACYVPKERNEFKEPQRSSCFASIFFCFFVNCTRLVVAKRVKVVVCQCRQPGCFPARNSQIVLSFQIPCPVKKCVAYFKGSETLVLKREHTYLIPICCNISLKIHSMG